VEDALHATRAAVEEGIVPGGGVALLRVISALTTLELAGEQQFGVNIIKRALEEPLRMIAVNAGMEGAIVVDKVAGGKEGFGFDASSEDYCDMIEAGIIDPTKVTRSALQNAASVAGLMLTTEAAIAEVPKQDAGAGMPGGMPGMGGMGGMGGMDMM